jgi:hypothetical protein
MYIDAQYLSVKTVPTDYSWDEGNPVQSTLVDCLCSEGQLIGYAPFCNMQIKSIIGRPNVFALAFNRKANFGDFYNSETSTQSTTTSGEHIFCHNYIMPGEYTLKIEQTQYITLNNEGRFECLQRHCVDWNWYNRQCDLDSPQNTTWANTASAGTFEKRWIYEKCEDDALGSYGVYYERGQSTEDRLPFSWQWYNFFNEDCDRRTEIYASVEPRQERLPSTDLPRTWDDAVFQGPYQVTWDDAAGPCIETRAEDSSWRWNKVLCNSNEVLNQKISWKDTKTNEIIPRIWRQVRGAGCLEVVPLLSAQTLTTTQEAHIKIIEIPPTVYLHIEQQPLSNTSPHTVRLSPRYIRCGSFPIERIVWDLGDGSPLFEQIRYDLNKEEPFVYSDQYGFDVDDPRNYDVIHTYYRTATDSSCFYPSITAYASSTNTSDCAAVVIGPLEFEPNNAVDFHLLQNKLTEKGTAYLGELNNDLALWNHQLSAS